MPRLIVLKFGGSVLTGVEGLRRAVDEIERWRRAGWSVVAVPSALFGRTDERCAYIDGCYQDAGGNAIAAYLAVGELESAAHLGLELEKAGVNARVLSPGAIGLRGAGDPLDATPSSFDARSLRRTAESIGVVVVPGFVATDSAGAWVTLGRGGSDLSALHLADAIRAERCRLIKDVDGLYEHDPASPRPKPARYERITWDDALELDGRILQHKGVRFAKARRLRFEVAGFGADHHTAVGPDASVLSERCPDTTGGDPSAVPRDAGESLMLRPARRARDRIAIRHATG